MNPARAVPTYAELIGAAATRLTGAGIDTARLDAEVLLGFVLGGGRSAVYARLGEPAAAGVEVRLAALVDRRAGREPIAYLTGVQEFWSLPFAVSPAVLIPRPETERVVEIACELVRATPALRRDAALCDIGTGSGCIAVAIARELPWARLTAVDVSTEALAVARANAASHGVAERISFVDSDLFARLEEARFDVIVSNPPYLAPDELLSPEIAFEPGTALTAGADGLAVIDRLCDEAPRHLRRGGALVMEIGAGQAAAVQARAAAAAFASATIATDLAGLPRVLVARVE